MTNHLVVACLLCPVALLVGAAAAFAMPRPVGHALPGWGGRDILGDAQTADRAGTTCRSSTARSFPQRVSRFPLTSSGNRHRRLTHHIPPPIACNYSERTYPNVAPHLGV